MTNNKQGFSLMELLIVIGIIGVLVIMIMNNVHTLRNDTKQKNKLQFIQATVISKIIGSAFDDHSYKYIDVKIIKMMIIDIPSMNKQKIVITDENTYLTCNERQIYNFKLLGDKMVILVNGEQQ